MWFPWTVRLYRHVIFVLYCNSPFCLYCIFAPQSLLETLCSWSIVLIFNKIKLNEKNMFPFLNYAPTCRWLLPLSMLTTVACPTAGVTGLEYYNVFMPPPFEEWWRGKVLPLSVRACVRSLSKFCVLLNFFERLHRFNSNLVCWYIISKHRPSSIWVTIH